MGVWNTCSQLQLTSYAEVCELILILFSFTPSCSAYQIRQSNLNLLVTRFILISIANFQTIFSTQWQLQQFHIHRVCVRSALWEHITCAVQWPIVSVSLSQNAQVNILCRRPINSIMLSKLPNANKRNKRGSHLLPCIDMSICVCAMCVSVCVSSCNTHRNIQIYMLLPAFSQFTFPQFILSTLIRDLVKCALKMEAHAGGGTSNQNIINSIKHI